MIKNTANAIALQHYIAQGFLNIFLQWKTAEHLKTQTCAYMVAVQLQ